MLAMLMISAVLLTSIGVSAENDILAWKCLNIETGEYTDVFIDQKEFTGLQEKCSEREIDNSSKNTRVVIGNDDRVKVTNTLVYPYRPIGRDLLHRIH